MGTSTLYRQTRVSYDLFVVLPPTLASTFVVYHHATELALVFAGLLPHDGSAWGGRTARHGCCMQKRRQDLNQKESNVSAL